MENKKDYYALKVEFYSGEEIIKVLHGTSEDKKLNHLIILTNYYRFIIIDITE